MASLAIGTSHLGQPNMLHTEHLVLLQNDILFAFYLYKFLVRKILIIPLAMIQNNQIMFGNIYIYMRERERKRG